MKAPSVMFGLEFNIAAFYPVRVLYEMPVFYNAHEAPENFKQELEIPVRQSTDKKVMTGIWLCKILELNPTEVKSVVSRIKGQRAADTNDNS